MKHLCTFLTLLLVLGCLAGCGSSQPEKDSCTYTVHCYGSGNNEAVAGVVINFCTDTACTPVTSDETGTAVFSGPPAKYHVDIIKTPDGWELAQEESEWDTESFDETYRIPFTEVEK